MIELLTNENREELRDFLKKHWRENHIFVEDPEYFAYEVDTSYSKWFLSSNWDRGPSGSG
ncbi:hypothetical protein HPA05_00865 [Streptococcus suis]|nr:hypothetical protein [Streptococcus suis]